MLVRAGKQGRMHVRGARSASQGRLRGRMQNSLPITYKQITWEKLSKPERIRLKSIGKMMTNDFCTTVRIFSARAFLQKPST